MPKTLQTGSVLGYDSSWQQPAKTEKHAYDLVSAKDWSFKSTLYIGFPWASLIDGLNRNVEIGSVLKKALDQLIVDPGYKRIITVCQHIKFREHIKLFQQVGITDIFASHAVVNERVYDGINIHPFPLFPVQAVGNTPSERSIIEELEEFESRKYRYSFIGAYNPKYYLTNSRELIFQLPENSESFILDRNCWHFDNRVYGQQIYGKDISDEELSKETAEAKEFVSVLKSTKFSPCPSGSGPNSIRLWESIEFGCIPVILAQDLRLPGRPELWAEASIILDENEKDISNIPELLKGLENNKKFISRKLAAVTQLRQLYGQARFITDIENLVNDIEEANQIATDKNTKTIFLETGYLDRLNILAWVYYINCFSQILKLNSVVFIDKDDLPDLETYSDLFRWVTIKFKVHGFDQCHNWSKEDLAYISDSTVLSVQLIQKISRIHISAKNSPQLINPSLFDDMALLLKKPESTLNSQSYHYRDFVQLDLLSNLREWVPMCSMLTSMYDGDEFIDGFLKNSSDFSYYENIEHFIVRPASPGQEHTSVLNHVRKARGAIYIWLSRDPRLYEVWNLCSKLSTAKYLTNANIDDRRSPEHIRTLTHLMDTNRDVDVASSALRFTEKKNLTWEDSGDCPDWYSNEPEEVYSAKQLLKLKNDQLISYNMAHCMPVWRHFLHIMNGYFNEPEFGPSSDWEFWLRCGQYDSKFYISHQALGLYLRHEESYWRRAPSTSAFDQKIVDAYSDSNFSYLPNVLTTTALRTAKMLKHKREQENLAFLFDFFALIKTFLEPENSDMHLKKVIEHIGSKVLRIDEIEDLTRSICPCFNKSGEEASVTEFTNFLISISHSLAERKPNGWKASADLVKHACSELYVTTQCVDALLLKAYLYGQADDKIAENHFLQRAYEKSSSTFWNKSQSVYRFSKPLAATSEALECLPSFGNFSGIKQGQTLFFFPDYSHGNPYQSLLYEDLEAKGVNSKGVSSLDGLNSGEVKFNEGDICHIHWINIVFRGVEDELLEESIGNFLETVRSLKSRGMKIYWTVHNRYSHDFPHQSLEKSFRKQLYNLANKVFIHHPILLEQLDEWLPDIQKVEFIEHGNYIGRYADEISSEEARKTLTLNSSDFVISVLGQIRPYKDLHLLLPVIKESMLSNKRLKLVVAGKINCEKTLAELEKMPENQVLIKNEFIADEEIQIYIKAASFVLLSYRDILTSGSLFQAFSFGIPVIAPMLGSIPTYVVDNWNGFLYTCPDKLKNILSDPSKLTSTAYKHLRENSRRTAQSLTWVKHQS